MGASKDKASSPVALWVLAGGLGLGGVGLFAYGVTRPEPPRNLADPMPLAALDVAAKPVVTAKPSKQREKAQAQNDAKKKECDLRFHDCSNACEVYAAQTPGRKECQAYCDRTQASCLSWTHR